MALFDSIEELKKHNSSIAKGLSLGVVQSFIDDAISKHLVEAIGKSMFSELVEAKSAEVDPTSKMSDLLHLTQKACAHLAIANYVPFGSVLLSDSGAHVHSSSNQLPASDAKLSALRKQAMDEGYHALETLVDFLENNLSEFPAYADSEAHQNNRSLFINSARDFSLSVSVVVNVRLFTQMRNEISHVERDSIEPILGDDLTASLRDKMKSNTPLSKVETSLLKHIQSALGPLALAGMIPYGAITIGTDSICRSTDNLPSADSRSQKWRMQEEMVYLNKRGENRLEALRSFLNKNRDSFPSYKGKESTGTIKINSTSSAVYLM